MKIKQVKKTPMSQDERDDLERDVGGVIGWVVMGSIFFFIAYFNGGI